MLERNRKLLGVKMRRGWVVVEAKAFAKQKKIALPVTPASRPGFLHQGECKGRDGNSRR